MSSLWSWKEPLGRRSFALLGVGLFFVKYNADRLLSWAWGHRPWLPWSYILPNVGNHDTWNWPKDRPLALTLAATSLPFIAVGILLVQRRLRDVGWPLWLVVVFFIPFVNLAFFLTLSLLPSIARPADADPAPAGRWRQAFKFRTAFASAAAAVGLTVALAVPVAIFSTEVAKSYGWGLFVGVPFFCGFLASILHASSQRRTLGECTAVACMTVIVAGGLLILFAVEGAICVLMAAPIAFGLAFLGGVAGYGVQNELWSHQRGPSGRVYAAAWLVLPTLVALEPALPRPPPEHSVTTSITIAASPETVWKNVIAFSQLPPPTELIFRSGIAYPIRARIFGSGVDAVRHCEFSTGPFIEPVTVWDPPRRLAFNVTSEPAPMNELSPYHDLHPPHLDGFFRSQHGEFRLTALPDGSTQLDGTTWYVQSLWPSTYWSRWSDYLVHQIHLRVLRHIQVDSESLKDL